MLRAPTPDRSSLVPEGAGCLKAVVCGEAHRATA